MSKVRIISNVPSEFVTPKEAAEILRVTRRTVDRYAAEGRLTKRHVTARHVLFLREQVENLLQDGPVPVLTALDNPAPRGRERPIDAPIHGRAFGPAGG